MRKSWLIFTVGIVGFLMFPVVYGASGEVDVFVEGEKVVYDVEPDVINGRTMVPMRITGNALGIQSYWHQDDREARFIGGGKELTFNFKDNRFLEDGIGMNMDVEPRIVSGRVLVPLRVLSESFGYSVVWTGNETREVIITKGKNIDEGIDEGTDEGTDGGYGNEVPVESKDFGDRELQEGFGHLVSWEEHQIHNAFEDAYNKNVSDIHRYHIDESNIIYVINLEDYMVLYTQKREYDFHVSGGYGLIPVYGGEGADYSSEGQYLLNLGIIGEADVEEFVKKSNEVSKGELNNVIKLDSGYYLSKLDKYSIGFTKEKRKLE